MQNQIERAVAAALDARRGGRGGGGLRRTLLEESDLNTA